MFIENALKNTLGDVADRSGDDVDYFELLNPYFVLSTSFPKIFPEDEPTRKNRIKMVAPTSLHPKLRK
jgi:hypothetical protein